MSTLVYFTLIIQKPTSVITVLLCFPQKVETIGDAYMVVCGVPEKLDVHAQPVANMALDMIEQALCVMSPATGKPLQVR